MSAMPPPPSSQYAPTATTLSNRMIWTGRILSGIAVLFLTFDVVGKLIAPKAIVDAMVQSGWPAHHVTTIGILGLVCLVLYLIPRTAPIGAIMWTGYFGGAIATNLRLDLPLFTYILAPVYVAAFVWGGLYLRDARVRGLVGSRR